MTSHLDQLLSTHHGQFPINESRLIEIVDGIYECAKTCATCADACLGEDDPKAQAACITSCQNCGEVCLTTARVLSRVTGFNREAVRPLVEACRQICRNCAEECANHAAEMEHCGVCAEVCRNCADAWQTFLQELEPA